MRTLTLNAVVQHDHTVTVRLPEDISPGPRQFVIVLQDEKAQPKGGPLAGSFPTVNVGPWPEGLNLRREDLYGDDSR